jgi:CopG family transcriptional regulator, nickel-responsive regulator
MSIKRFGVSLDEAILNQLDSIAQDQRLPNRSRAIGYLVKNHQVINQATDEQIVTGAIILVYDHRVSRLHSEVAGLKHEYHCMVLSSQHLHIDEQNCIETITVKSNFQRVKKLADKLIAIKGVKHGNFVVTTIENYINENKLHC